MTLIMEFGSEALQRYTIKTNLPGSICMHGEESRAMKTALYRRITPKNSEYTDISK